MTTPRKRTSAPRPALTEASRERVFDALQALSIKHGSMAAAARVVGVSRQAAHQILYGRGVSSDLAGRILRAADNASDVERRPTALERLRAGRAARRENRRAAAIERPADVDRDRIEQAAEERRVAADMRRSEARLAMGPPVASRSPLDSLAAVVATLLVRHTIDPIAELDAGREGAFARRVERHVLAALLDKYGGPNAVALAIRGRKVGATLQRNFARHRDDLGPLSDELAREVDALLSADPSAWLRLVNALEEEERAAE